MIRINLLGQARPKAAEDKRCPSKRPCGVLMLIGALAAAFIVLFDRITWAEQRADRHEATHLRPASGKSAVAASESAGDAV